MRRLGVKTAEEALAEETTGLDVRFHAGKVDASELPSSYKPAAAVAAQIESFDLAEIVDWIDPYPDANPRKEARSLWQDLRHRLQLLGISVLWIDEAQDLFCADRKLILRALKSLMQGDDAVIVVLSGTEDLAKVIRTDPQVQRRFTAMVLPDLVEQVDGDSFRDIITQYCERVGLGAPIEADLIGRIFHGARYRFGRALELLLQAMEIAIGRGDEDLDIGHFAAAYAMNEACTAAENVFYAEHYWLLKPDTVEEEEHPRRKKR